MYQVLIADDEPLMRKALEIIIEKIDGFHVAYSVGNGEEAVDICKKSKVDLVFMDIMMPGESGIESSKKIYLHNPNIVIYIVSAYKNFDFAKEALSIKVSEYITKPVSFDIITNLLLNFKKEKNTKGKNLEELIDIIDENNFKNMYYSISKVIDKLYGERENNPKEIEESIRKLEDRLLVNKTLYKNYEEAYKILNSVDIKCKKSLEFWLFSLMNYIFQVKSIEKYSILKSIFSFINENIEKEIGLSEIIDNCNVSQGYLSRIFRKTMKVSVMEYIHMTKIYIAKRYFSFTDYSIAEVAFLIGYNESSYFGKVFKKYENTTINKYRNNKSII